MNLKKKLLKKSYLYFIVDKKISGKRSIFDIVSKIRNKDTGIVQLRDKESDKETVLREAQTIRKLLSNTKILFIVNDYPDIAKIVNSDGIHLGQKDLSIETARRILGSNKIIGISCHTLNEAIIAEARGADYVSMGPIFSTSTKLEYRPIGLDIIKKIKRKIRIPFFVIGGINEKNVEQVLSLGVKRVAVCSAVCKAKNILSTVKNFSKILNS